MNKAIQFKALQRRLKFRNPNHWTELPGDFHFSLAELLEARKYLDQLNQLGIKFTFPGDSFYPTSFLSMKEPPLFLEYQGPAFWLQNHFISIVGSRELTGLSEQWMKNHLSTFMELSSAGIVSGGARGVDQLSHVLAIKSARPTVMVLPSGLKQLYPPNLKELTQLGEGYVCLMSEFERDQKIHKSHFYFRNRLIAALGQVTLVVQATLKSGSLLTVHHCLENGRPVSVVPSHPEMIGFDGSLKLLKEGAFLVQNFQDLLDFWNAEFYSK